ncbi:bifunctional 5,10-methylenetetrahydrofolate dehydrogenase/5,10-methenyltetrahydrofolate cyclohydrolase [Boudabousia marimammalium]|uniref:Bifunctional protein FolD n=1 Tax=Boudabousia marimammalium TaxID=156892 RepID=A0A1Q5PSC5_9ACTO|nr:tetrahydrofolate dehydrogenase/cyclohydrolase catalytic domain-containing protein [Boudabousia marimammalium]OKL50345.1 bifunctional methylenetetrahydrofolate dehydrogenase/methenyltetrahydrofolate cyclohydrolase [Boudabousia marimammalium]
MRAGWSGSAQKLDGIQCAKEIKADLAARVEKLKAAGKNCYLATILVGDDPASATYVKHKHEDCVEIGLASRRVDLPQDASQDAVLAEIAALNEDPNCVGFIVQLPLPEQIDTARIIAAIDPEKDADGLHPMNLGKLVASLSGPLDFPAPCTPRACLELLKWGGVPLEGANICMVGNGMTVGRSFGLLASRVQPGATVTTCHIGTRNLAEHTRVADIVISAVGVPGLITADMIKPGAAVLDVGISRVQNPQTGKFQLTGDVADGVDEVAAWLSPNPGGIGPMTRALLIVNVVEAAERL